MNRFKELLVWQKAIDLAVEVYKITEKLPEEERYGLISQINRSVISIPSNIAEGAGRNTAKEFNNFLGIAQGSSFELDIQLIISNRLDFITTEDYQKFEKRLEHIQNMIAKLKMSLNV
ncbi:four helix bundle protein [Algoriphagus aestuariicola]|jgi:four helix bundle protein|uniref:Four helix bundle protein n=1 Tax=Algoriphagus aestuariicola TaxID=1852016 RepID=A0ABS3BR83_9BACT|nr:four helix bundle protein [Algoriphagus aestuariicola]MBN7801805.1 four helix bundle protein [Algoriphagus aestuariicola]